MKVKFGMFSSQLSEMFWECIEKFIKKYRNLLYMRHKLLTLRVAQYEEASVDAGCPLDSGVGFIDYTMI